MKKGLLVFIILFYINHCLAQDTVRKKNSLTQFVTERFYVLNSDKQTKQGLYQALYRRNIAIASGLYRQNKKAGIWHFYDTQGILLQNFNYDTNTILYEKPDDLAAGLHIRYAFDDSIKNADHVTKPMKCGGWCYGYIPYLSIFKLSADYAGTDLSQFTAILEILVSPGGRLADFKVHISSESGERITTFSPELIADEDKLFVPATINHKPVLCRIFVKCRITNEGELDVD